MISLKLRLSIFDGSMSTAGISWAGLLFFFSNIDCIVLVWTFLEVFLPILELLGMTAVLVFDLVFFSNILFIVFGFSFFTVFRILLADEVFNPLIKG